MLLYRVIICCALLLSVINIQAATVAERIKPAGKVNVAGQTKPKPAPKPTPVATATSPEKIYNQNCVICHQSGTAGAPKLGDKAAWAERKKQGTQQLIKNVINGKGFMPPRGGCADCSDDDIKSVIEYMINYKK